MLLQHKNVQVLTLATTAIHTKWGNRIVHIDVCWLFHFLFPTNLIDY